jgi:hypothetical protein
MDIILEKFYNFCSDIVTKYFIKIKSICIFMLGNLQGGNQDRNQHHHVLY